MRIFLSSLRSVNNTLYIFGVYKNINNAWSICPPSTLEGEGKSFLPCEQYRNWDSEMRNLPQIIKEYLVYLRLWYKYQLCFTCYVLGTILSVSHLSSLLLILVFCIVDIIAVLQLRYIYMPFVTHKCSL